MDEKQFNEQWIVEADVLSMEDCLQIEDEYLACEHPWWTKSHTNHFTVIVVLFDGSMKKYGLYMGHLGVWMRPALRLTNDCELQKGDVFEYKGKRWRMVLPDTALCGEAIEEIPYWDGELTINGWILPDGTQLENDQFNAHEGSYLQRRLLKWADSLGIPTAK